MLSIVESSVFRRDVKRIKKRGLDLQKLSKVVQLLANRQPLAAHYRDHQLIGNFGGCRECHIEPDWLLIYSVKDNQLALARTGTHADLFKK